MPPILHLGIMLIQKITLQIYDASRGLEAANLVNGCRWLSGPNFVRKNGIFQAPVSEKFDLNHDNPEVKRTVVHKIYSKNSH